MRRIATATKPATTAAGFTLTPRKSANTKKKAQNGGHVMMYTMVLVFPLMMVFAISIDILHSHLTTMDQLPSQLQLQQSNQNKNEATTSRQLSKPVSDKMDGPRTVAPQAPGPSMNQPKQPSNYTSTIVTAYFSIRSKYPKEKYMDWMLLMLSVQDPLVVFTTQDWVQTISHLRNHALDRTHFVILDSLERVPLATDFSTDVWEHQLSIDPEAKHHAGYEVFWIWLSKTWFLTEAIRTNPFHSEYFVWSDIGCFRGGKASKHYKSQWLVRHPEVIPDDRVLFLSHKEQPHPPDSLWWTNKLGENDRFYHSGSQMAGRGTTIQQFHDAFLRTMRGFLERDLFIGDDQTVFQCTCTQNPHLCAYVTRNQVKDNHYFGLRYALFQGGTYDLWYPPELSSNVTADAASVKKS